MAAAGSARVWNQEADDIACEDISLPALQESNETAGWRDRSNNQSPSCRANHALAEQDSARRYPSGPGRRRQRAARLRDDAIATCPSFTRAAHRDAAPALDASRWSRQVRQAKCLSEH